jgi:hypothetical protein
MPDRPRKVMDCREGDEPRVEQREREAAVAAATRASGRRRCIVVVVAVVVVVIVSWTGKRRGARSLGGVWAWAVKRSVCGLVRV